MIYYIITALIGLLVGAIIIYIVLQPKIKLNIQKDNEALIYNQELSQQKQLLEVDINALQKQANEVRQAIAKLEGQKEEVINSLTALQAQNEEAAKIFYQDAIETMQEAYETEASNISNNLEMFRIEASNEYIATLKDAADNFQQEISSKTQELRELDDKLATLQQLVTTATEARKREEEKIIQQNFYRLNLSQEDIDEIKKLREVLPFLRDKDPLNKVIYKVYYERAYTDLIGRVVGSGIHCGIYKITNIENGMCYVGQAVNIAERWRQHIKRGVGAETPTRNKLYPAMLAIGVENFTFEIIEECNRNQLDEREDYWQTFFHAKDYGYSIK